MAVIYQITNMANGKYYIGSAESFARREWQHKYDLKRGTHKNPKLQAAWNKYGPDVFVFEIIEVVAEGREAFDVENTYLMRCIGDPQCYNINADAYKPRLGQTHSEATKAKIRANRIAPAGLSHYRFGQEVPPEVREKIGAAQRGKSKAAGRTVSEEGKAKIRANIEAGRSHKHWGGRTHTEESRAKMSKTVHELTEQQDFPSLTAVLQHYGMTMPTLRRALLADAPITKGRFTGLWFRYGTPKKLLAPLHTNVI